MNGDKVRKREKNWGEGRDDTERRTEKYRDTHK